MRPRCLASAARVLAGLGLISLAHCAGITVVPEPVRRAYVRDDGLLTLVGSVHVHSFRSHDSQGSDEEIERAAEGAGLDFVLLTDHRDKAGEATGREWRSEGTLFVPGFEINFAGGSLFLFGTPPGFAPTGEPEELAPRAVQEGAVLGLGHLETMQESAGVSAAAVEVFNLHAAARDASTLKIVLGALFRSAGSFIDQLSSLDERTLAFADRSTQPRAVFLGGDAHANVRLLWGLLGTVASYDDVFRSITTHVLAPEKSREAILAALARGQCYGVFARQGDARGFDFRFEAGNTIVPMGAEARLDAEAPLTLLRVRTPQSAHITLTRDGAIVAEEDGSELVHPTRIPGRYRVIAYAFERPWIVSSAIDITGEP